MARHDRTLDELRSSPALQAASEALTAAREAIAVVQERANRELRPLRAAEGAALNSVRQLVAEHFDVAAADLVLGSWDCDDSPVGACVYDQATDRMCDFCLVCGEPDERK